MSKKTSIDDIKGIVKCEPTDSVEEVRKLRGREPRYSDGTSAKYYYNLNRCISDGKIQFDTTNMPKETYEVNGQTYCGSNALMDLLNELHEENNELRLQLNLCSDQRNEFHRGVRENANRVGKLEKENEQLKQRIRQLELSCECQAEFIANKGFDIRDVAEFARRSNNDRE